MNYKKLWQNRSYRNLFLGLSMIFFVMIYAVLYMTGLVPSELRGQDSIDEDTIAVETESNSNFVETITSATKPTRISIPSVGINTVVYAPTSPEVSVLDAALTKGAVYYPGSGVIEEGNVFVFGHSTGLSVVNNQAYKTFNNLKKVVSGDLINVTGENGKTYVYRAISTELVNDNEALVSFGTESRMLTLSTCNTFGLKQERHVVKAEFVEELDS